MTTVRLRSVELKSGCEVTLLPAGAVKMRTSQQWDASVHGVDLAYEVERRLIRCVGSNGNGCYVPADNAKCWVEDGPATVRLKVQEPEELAAQQREIAARVEGAAVNFEAGPKQCLRCLTVEGQAPPRWCGLHAEPDPKAPTMTITAIDRSEGVVTAEPKPPKKRKGKA